MRVRFFVPISFPHDSPTEGRLHVAERHGMRLGRAAAVFSEITDQAVGSG